MKSKIDLVWRRRSLGQNHAFVRLASHRSLLAQVLLLVLRKLTNQTVKVHFLVEKNELPGGAFREGGLTEL